jgi:D-sedoheptulose 7-phosphate isomerase
MMSMLLRNLQEHQQVMAGLATLAEPVEQAGRLVARSLGAGGKLLLCGNGGSAADCQHIAAELTGRFIKDRRPLAAISLTTDSSALTCIGNDYSYDDVFVRPLQALGRPGDVLLAISTSGNSGNVVKAVQAARELGVVSVGLLGRDGGKLGPLCDHALIVQGTETARIQEAHILIGHTLCNLIEDELGLS